MTDEADEAAEAADRLLAAGRALRLRCYMGPLPFDADAWLRKGLDSDLPAPTPEGGEWHYHFEVRDSSHAGVYFTLRCGDDGAPYLRFDSRSYPADPDGLRALAAALNAFVRPSVLSPKHIYLHGSSGFHEALGREFAYQADLERVWRRLDGHAVAPARPPTDGPGPARHPTRRRRWRWPWNRG